MKKSKKKTKKLKLNDIVIVNGIHSYVAFINHNDYWLSSSDDHDGPKPLYTGCCFAKIDSKGNLTIF